MTENQKKSVITVLAVFLSVLINILGSKFAGLFSFPLYMDSVATMGVAAVFGMAPSVVVAILSNFFLSRFATTALPFTLCHICTAVFASLIFKKTKETHKGFLTIESFLWAGLASAFSNSLLGDTFSLILFWGNTTIPQVDNAVQGILIATQNIPFAVYWGGTVTNIIDKIIAAIFSLGVYTVYCKFSGFKNAGIVYSSKNSSKIIRVEYIIIFLAIVNLAANSVFKYKAEKMTKNCYSALQNSLYENEKPSLDELSDSLSAYSYFNDEISKKIRLLETASFDSENLTSSNDFRSICLEIQELLYADHDRLLFGFDSLTISSFILIFILVIILINKADFIQRKLLRVKIANDEQQKLSMNIHDSALQNLAALELQLQNKDFEKSMFFARTTVSDLRYLCGVLKIKSDEPFVSYAHKELEIFASAYNIQEKFYSSVKNDYFLSDEKTKELKYIYQELLSNVARHSAAQSVTVKILEAGSRLIINITDDGTGFDISAVAEDKTSHHGIKNVRTRVKLLGGTVEWKKADGGGTSVIVEI